VQGGRRVAAMQKKSLPFAFPAFYPNPRNLVQALGKTDSLNKKGNIESSKFSHLYIYMST
jgi:hypothetical protein